MGTLTFSQRAGADSISPWGSTTNYPVNVDDQSCAVYSGYIYCVGGDIGFNPSNPVYYAPVSSAGIGTWVRSPNNYPLGIYAQSCVIGTVTSQFGGTTADIYCVGGEDSNGNGVDSVYAASVSASGVGSWIALASYPTGISHSSCVVSEEQYTSPPPLKLKSTVPYITCVGGITDSDFTGVVWTFSDGTGTWSEDTAYPLPVGEQSCVYDSSYIYCVGGYILSGGNQFVSNGVDFAPVSSSGVGPWASTTHYPDSDIEAASCVAYSGYMYCVGGQVQNQPTAGVYYAALSSSGVGTWTTGNSYPFGLLGIQRASNLCALYPGSDGYIFCVGNNAFFASESIYYSEIVPTASTTTVVSTITLPASTTTVTSNTTTTVTSTSTSPTTVTQTSTSTTTVTQPANSTATATSTLTATATETSTITATHTETLTNTATADATATATVTATSASTVTVTTTAPAVTVTTGQASTATATVTSTIHNTATVTSGGSQGLTPYLIVGVAVVAAAGLLGAVLFMRGKASV
ncbi:MAG: hypothetical protein OK449_08610 [Thaumarchaeota archaeon]|nr:hypothetical protein [Nitrososphaerota archaeon]